MKIELIIEKYGLGHAVVVLDKKKIIDCFIDPVQTLIFIHQILLLEAKIQRRISKRGGYFVKLPNGTQGFLKSKKIIMKGSSVVLLSKFFLIR